jgi:RES domain-containing protein
MPPTGWQRMVGTREKRHIIGPSVLIPEEWNFLLNPYLYGFQALRVSPPQPFQFDYQLWG